MSDDDATRQFHTYPFPQQPIPSPERPWYTRWWMIFLYSVFGTLLFFCILGLIGSALDDPGGRPDERTTESPSLISDTTEDTTPTEEATPAEAPTTVKSEGAEDPEPELEPEPEPEPEASTQEDRGDDRPTESEPSPTEEHEPEQDVYYENCDAARAAGAAPVYRGDPGYGKHLDRDGDGVGCES
ncbi:hypothetical protein GCM10027447_20280 [Glycomyces halotolerans]